MSNDVNKRLAAIVARKRAADAEAEESTLAVKRAADEKGAKRAAARTTWENICRPMIQRTIERFNKQTASEGITTSILDAAKSEPAIADARIMLQLSGTKSPFAMTINVNAYGMMTCRSGSAQERPVSMHLDALTDAVFEGLLLDFLDKSVAAAAQGKALPQPV